MRAELSLNGFCAVGNSPDDVNGLPLMEISSDACALSCILDFSEFEDQATDPL